MARDASPGAGSPGARRPASPKSPNSGRPKSRAKRHVHGTKTLHYVRSKLLGIIQLVEKRQKSNRKFASGKLGEAIKPCETPRTAILDEMTLKEMDMLKKEHEKLLRGEEYEELQAFFNPLPTEIDDLQAYLKRLRSVIKKQRDMEQNSLKYIWLDELADAKNRCLLTCLEHGDPRPPTPKPKIRLDRYDRVPCQRPPREDDWYEKTDDEVFALVEDYYARKREGLPAEKPCTDDRLRHHVVKERRAETHFAEEHHTNFEYKVKKNAFKARQQREAEKEGLKRHNEKHEIAMKILKRGDELMTEDDRYFRDKLDARYDAIDRARATKAAMMQDVVVSRQQRNQEWNHRRQDAAQRRCRDAAAQHAKAEADAAAKQQRFEELQRVNDLPSSGVRAKKLNQELKHRIVHHLRAELDDEADALADRRRQQKDAQLQAAAERRRVGLQKYTFVEPVFGKEARALCGKRWSSTGCLSRKSESWKREFPSGLCLHDTATKLRLATANSPEVTRYTHASSMGSLEPFLQSPSPTRTMAQLSTTRSPTGRAS